MKPPQRHTIRIDTHSSDDDDPVLVVLDPPSPKKLPIPVQPSGSGSSGQDADFDALTDALESLSVRDIADQTLYETRNGLSAHW